MKVLKCYIDIFLNIWAFLLILQMFYMNILLYLCKNIVLVYPSYLIQTGETE